MHVCQLIHALEGGGAETQLRTLCRELPARGFDITVICVESRGVSDLGPTVKIREVRRSGKWQPGYVRRLMRAVAETGSDLVHTWLPASITIPALVAARLNGMPAIFSYRNRMFFHRPVSAPEFVVASLCARRVVSNNHIKHSSAPYRWLYAAKRGVRIPNAVVLEPGTGATWRWQRAHDDLPVVLFAGRIVRQKNWQTLLDAAERIPHGLDFRLVICGTGHEEAALRERVRSHPRASRIECLGYADNLHQRMAEAAVFVSPSTFEGMPNALLEAMAVGVPCAASRIPEHEYLAGSTDALSWFEARDADDLARRIVELLSDRRVAERRSLAAINRAEHFSVDAMVDSYADLYRETCAGG